jgi:uncharacterized protein YlxW (UPF0749 family)
MHHLLRHSKVGNFSLISLFFSTLFFIYYLDKRRENRKRKERLRLESEENSKELEKRQKELSKLNKTS